MHVVASMSCSSAGRALRAAGHGQTVLGLESLVLHRVVQSANGQLRATGFTGKKAK